MHDTVPVNFHYWRPTLNTSQKLLLAIVVSTALATPVMAQNIEVYGRAHVSVDALDNGNDTGMNVSSNSSRLGFRAKHELDGGLEAFMQIETNIRYDQGNGGALGSRDTFAGIRGGFGQLRVGFFDTPTKLVRSNTDMFGDRLGDARNFTSGDNMSFDNRFRNGVHYRSPGNGPVTFDIQYSPHNAQGATAENNQTAISTALTYRQGDWYAVVAYEMLENAVTTADGTVLDPSVVRVGAYYNVKPEWRISAFFQSATDIVGGDRTVYGVGTSYRSGEWTYRAQFYAASDNDTADTGANMLVLGADRRLGRSTNAYLVYAMADNEPAATFQVSAGGRDTRLPALAGETQTGLSVGLVYSF